MSLDRLLHRQAGVLTKAQALTEGLSERTVRRRVASGAWREVHPLVYLVGGHRLTDEVKVRAAWLWAGGWPAAVTGEPAAFWHRMTVRPPASIEITVPRDTHKVPPAAILLRRRDLQVPDLTEVRGVRVAKKPLAVLESASELGSVFLDRALQRHVGLAELRQSYWRNTGAWGWPEVGRLLGAAADGGESEAERRLVRLLRDAGIDGWVLGHPFRGYTIDVAFPELRLAVEVDGWAWHSDAARFAADRRKGNVLTGGGWSLLRFTWHDIDGAPADVEWEIRRMIANCGGRRPDLAASHRKP